MSDDRNARGLEDLVQRLDRLFFCRSFHSKLFPFGDLCLKAEAAGLYPSSRPKPDPKTLVPQDTCLKTPAGRDDNSVACPPEPDGLAAGWHGVSRFEPNSQPPLTAMKSETRSSPVYAGHAIKPLDELAFGHRRLQSRTGRDQQHRP
jgi:hypothetical protein